MDRNRKPTNLVYIFSDQHSKKVLGCYGNPYVHTPNMDRLASRGTLFRNAYTNNPICVPARASMTIGDYCHRHNYWDNCHPYAGKEEGWGHRLSQQGIKVTTIGKLHYVGNRPETGFTDQRIPLNVKDGKGDLTHTIRDGSISRPFLANEIRHAASGDSDYLRYDDKVATLAEAYMAKEGQSSQPWCLFIGFVLPHFPLRAPAQIIDNLYSPYDKLPFPIEWSKDSRPMHPALEYNRNEMCLDRLTDAEVRKAIAIYYGMVTYLDQQVGRVLDAIEAAGLSHNTRIIYTDDHGDSLGEHGLFFKHNMYEGSVGIPMIMAGPDIPVQEVIDDPVSLVDIFPTILDCTGIRMQPEDMSKPGRSLFKVIDCVKTGKPMDRVIFSEYHNVGTNHSLFMIRKKQYKLVYYVSYQPQLFDLDADPCETTNLAVLPEYKEILTNLERELRIICDPEEIDRICLADQLALLNAAGGRDKVLGIKALSYSPVPMDL